MAKFKLQHSRHYFYCPGCGEPHAINCDQPTSPRWTFDGNWEAPTVQPSVRVFFTKEDGTEITTCHLFIKEGFVHFLGDSLHALKGQTVPLPDYPPNW